MMQSRIWCAAHSAVCISREVKVSLRMTSISAVTIIGNYTPNQCHSPKFFCYAHPALCQSSMTEVRGCEKIVTSAPSARRTERRNETYQIDRRGASTAQHSDWSAQ